VDRIDRIGPNPSHWVRLELDPDREDLVERRRREEERRRRERREPPPEQTPPEDDPPHHVDVRA
jgi:hypothetical protein